MNNEFQEVITDIKDDLMNSIIEYETKAAKYQKQIKSLQSELSNYKKQVSKTYQSNLEAKISQSYTNLLTSAENWVKSIAKKYQLKNSLIIQEHESSKIQRMLSSLSLNNVSTNTKSQSEALNKIEILRLQKKELSTERSEVEDEISTIESTIIVILENFNHNQLTEESLLSQRKIKTDGLVNKVLMETYEKCSFSYENAKYHIQNWAEKKEALVEKIQDRMDFENTRIPKDLSTIFADTLAMKMISEFENKCEEFGILKENFQTDYNQSSIHDILDYFKTTIMSINEIIKILEEAWSRYNEIQDKMNQIDFSIEMLSVQLVDESEKKSLIETLKKKKTELDKFIPETRKQIFEAESCRLNMMLLEGECQQLVSALDSEISEEIDNLESEKKKIAELEVAKHEEISNTKLKEFYECVLNQFENFVR